jgi:uncharacterized protein (TIRG00374 family)
LIPTLRHQSLKRLAKLVLASLVLIFLFYFVGLGELLDQLKNLNTIYFILFLLISLPMIWASSVKWSLFLEGSVSVLHLMKLYTISYFINLFAPSTIGGDLARSYSLGNKVNSQAKALSATFFERLTGLLMMLVLSALSLALSPELLKAFGVKVLLFLCLCILGGGLFFLRAFRVFALNIILKLIEPLSSKKGFGKMIAFLEALKEEVSFSNALIFKSFLWSAVFHALTIVNTYLAGKSVGIENLDLLSLGAVVPMVLLILTIPITPGGLGVQEGAFVFLLTKVGMTSPEALAISLILRLKNIIIAGVGGLLMLRR